MILWFRNQNGKAPIHLAAAPSSYDALRAEHVPAIALAALLEIHANPVARDAHGNTPLMDAVLGGYFEVVKRLLQIAHVPANDKNKVRLVTNLSVANQADCCRYASYIRGRSVVSDTTDPSVDPLDNHGYLYSTCLSLPWGLPSLCCRIA